MLNLFLADLARTVASLGPLDAALLVPFAVLGLGCFLTVRFIPREPPADLAGD